jgi:hypothetical protein
MPRAKADFEALYPCEFYTPEELLDPEQMYTIREIARLLQGLDAEAEVDADTEAVLVDWAVPWVMVNAADLVIAEPPTEDDPGFYGLRTDADRDGAA